MQRSNFTRTKLPTSFPATTSWKVTATSEFKHQLAPGRRTNTPTPIHFKINQYKESTKLSAVRSTEPVRTSPANRERARRLQITRYEPMKKLLQLQYLTIEAGSEKDER
jgi:hypothetical protein